MNYVSLNIDQSYILMINEETQIKGLVYYLICHMRCQPNGIHQPYKWILHVFINRPSVTIDDVQSEDLLFAFHQLIVQLKFQDISSSIHLHNFIQENEKDDITKTKSCMKSINIRIHWERVLNGRSSRTIHSPYHNSSGSNSYHHHHFVLDALW